MTTRRFLKLVLAIASIGLACRLTNVKELELPTGSVTPDAEQTITVAPPLPEPTTRSTFTPAPVDKWSVWANGTQLRGANIYQRRVYPELDGDEFMGSGEIGPPFVQDDMDRLSELGANYVNISHPGLFSESPPYTLDQNVQDNLDHLLEMAARADMFVVISLRTGPGRSEFSILREGAGDWFDPSYINDEVWTEQAAQEGWTGMWRYIADRYRDNPAVVGYDLMVEPNSNEALLDIWQPEDFYPEHAGKLYDWNQFYPQLVTAIREVDTQTPILVGGQGYSDIHWLPYLLTVADPKIVYTFHQYAPMAYTHQEPPLDLSYPGFFDANEDGTDEQVDRGWLDGMLGIVDEFMAQHHALVAVNEFGAMRWEPGVEDFIRDEADLFEERGLNYAVWQWYPAWTPLTEGDNAFNFRFGSDPREHSDQENNLLNVMTQLWQRNTIRPSDYSGR